MKVEFTIYKPLSQDALKQVGAENPQQFAEKWAGYIGKQAGDVSVTGEFKDDSVHLYVDNEDSVAVSFALDDLGLSFGQGVKND